MLHLTAMVVVVMVVITVVMVVTTAVITTAVITTAVIGEVVIGEVVMVVVGDIIGTGITTPAYPTEGKGFNLAVNFPAHVGEKTYHRGSSITASHGAVGRQGR